MNAVSLRGVHGRAPLLFLDFDGVLHPNGCSTQQWFARAAGLAEVLAAFPEVDVVVSSSWRFHHPWPALVRRLPPVLRRRVLGHTGDAAYGRWPRFREIEAWWRRCGEGRPWRALDDAWWEFPTGCEQLIACRGGTGLTPRDLQLLSTWLSQQRSCRLSREPERVVTRPELIEPARRLLEGVGQPSVTAVQRHLRVGYGEALALLGACLRDQSVP
ncbi:HAD domain-containing protein [Roseateles sp.]|uniref:HAD domain-containing protein n=1 Tax=Roseateles sp. TaxID=1971397 RepID=UPI00393FF488